MSAPARVLSDLSPRRAPGVGPLVGQHPSILRLIESVHRASMLDAPVLIQGPTGAGKELVAQRLHAYSSRSGRLVTLNVASLPETLAESELFGSVRGAFTGAHCDRTGLIEEAAEGTLYLDEAAELSHALQIKLLRVLENGLVRLVGGTRDRLVRFRLVLSTQQSAPSLVTAGRWRADFYYRVAGISLVVPALAERCSDIPLLLDHFLALLGRPPLSLETTGVLGEYSWPGNVRELRRAVERAAFTAGERCVTLDDLRDAVAALQLPAVPASRADRRDQRLSLRDLEREHIEVVLRDSGLDTAAAAAVLGLSERALYRRFHSLGIIPPRRRLRAVR